jgi:DivIVA domain-containing protein
VEFTRRRSSLALGVSVLAVSVALLLLALATGMLWMLVVAALGLLIGIPLGVDALRPLRFHIGDAGLTVRHNRTDRLVSWPEVAAVILDEPTPTPDDTGPAPRLLLVPVDPAGFGLPSTSRDPLAGRPYLVLLDLAEVRESPDEVAGALTRFAGDRFTDVRRLVQEALGRPDFIVALRGYEIGPVEDLIRRGRLALVGPDQQRRTEVGGEIEAALGTLPVALRGYDRSQVDTFLRELATRLAG